MFKYIFLLFLVGCTVTANRDGDKMELRGFGAKYGKWADGAEIGKQEPLAIPDAVGSVE